MAKKDYYNCKPDYEKDYYDCKPDYEEDYYDYKPDHKKDHYDYDCKPDRKKDDARACAGQKAVAYNKNWNFFCVPGDRRDGWREDVMDDDCDYAGDMKAAMKDGLAEDGPDANSSACGKAVIYNKNINMIIMGGYIPPVD